MLSRFFSFFLQYLLSERNRELPNLGHNLPKCVPEWPFEILKTVEIGVFKKVGKMFILISHVLKTEVTWMSRGRCVCGGLSDITPQSCKKFKQRQVLEPFSDNFYLTKFSTIIRWVSKDRLGIFPDKSNKNCPNRLTS